MNLDAATRSERLLNQRKAAVLLGIVCLTFVGITGAQLARFVVGGDVLLDTGDVAVRDIRAPRRAQFVSEVETNRQRELAEASVGPIYTAPDAQISRGQLASARTLLDQIKQIRGAPNQSASDVTAQIIALPTISTSGLSLGSAQLLAALSDDEWTRVDSQVIAVLDVALRTPIQPDSLARTRASVSGLISLNLNSNEADATTVLVQAMLAPNTNFDAEATARAKQAARDSVLPVERTFEPNQVVIRSGQIIGRADIETLEQLNLRRPSFTLGDLLAALCFSTLATVILGLGFSYGRENVFSRPARNTALSAALFVLNLIVLRWVLPGHQLLPYFVSLLAIAMLITIWSGTLPGILSGVILSIMVGVALDKPLEYTTLFATGSIIACLSLGRLERLSRFLQAGVAGGIAQALIVLSFNLAGLQPQDVPQLALWVFASLISGLLAAAITPTILYLVGLLVDTTTIMQLIELSRPSHPLLQKLLVQAPGTYHHSLMVANLAEQAAERIGADSLLTRIGAYYHDIGKIINPHFFIENQLQGLNIHDQLDPLTSSTLLQAHVTDGLKLAKQYKLPARIRAFIAEHHGTMKTKYQYAQAIQDKQAPPDAALYSYPGPRPQSKETALLMLADGCEATVRAKLPATSEAMEAVIAGIFADRLSDHQLDDSSLTLREIELVRHSFVATLRGVYHARLQYPQLGENEAAPSIPPILNDALSDVTFPEETGMTSAPPLPIEEQLS